MRDFKSSIVVWYNDESGDHQTSGPSATLKAVTKCEGTEITVNVSSINNLFNYRWYNKSGTFNVLTSEATVLIPRDAEADTYYVNVDFTECSAGFTDSIFVDVIRVPEVTITPTSPTVCPGGEVQLTFTPTNPNGSPTGEYVIGHENNSIVTFINYSDLQTHEFSYTATSPNRFWVHSVSDSICTYIIPEDTVLISLREMTSSCDVTVNSDTVCYGGDVTFTATSPTLGSAYTVKWYDTPTQDNLLDEKYIATSGETATFTLSGLTADTAVYVTVMDELHCETHSGTVQRYLNMGDSIAVHMSCGENVRLFDSGGSAQYYGPGEKDTITFSSADPTDRITLSFNSFDLVGSDKLYVYSGPIVHTDSLIATLSGSTIPSDISSNSNALTLRFRSDLTDQAEGWDAVVGCSATPAEARVHVLDSVDVSLTVSPELPARYGHSIDITATAHGGRSTNYQYVWQESTDNQTWNDLTGAPIIDGLSNTYSYAALNQSTYVRVIVTDASSTPCSGPGSAVLYLEVANIALSLTLTSDVTSICQETFAMSANVKNEGGETATGVSVRLNLPAGMVYGNPADTVIVIGDVDAGETVSKTFNVHNEIYVNTNTTKNIQAQIESCDQGDGESVFQNWDWTRTPLENDEAEYQVTIHPSMDAMSTPGVSVDPVSVCYGQDATLTATPTISNPNIIWYADAALTEVVSTTNTYVAQQITEPRTYYVLAYNDEYCPSAAIVNHEIKLQYAVTDTLLMHNGTVQVGNNDHIRFYDDGGPEGNCTATSYTLLFTSADGSPLEIYFEGYQYFNTSALAIYDGNSVMGTNLTTNTQITDGSAFTASSGMMLVKFSSYDEYHNGFSAHVFTITRPAVAEAVASSRIGDAQTITPTDAIVCYSEDATLYATSTVAAPQTFIWYASDLFTVVRTEPIDHAGDPSTYTVPAPQREETYYVTVVGDGGCPLVPPIHNNYREVLLDGYWQSTTLAASDSVCLYDVGGKDGNYTADCTEYDRHFYSPFGSKIHLHISNLQMGYNNSNNGYVEVYWHNANGHIETRTLYGTQGEQQDFESVDNWMRVLFYTGCDYGTYPGLDAYVYAVMPQDSNNFAKARIKFKTPSFTDVNVTGSGAYCYGTQATLEASVENNTDELRYAWYDKNYNLLSINTGVTDTYHPTITSATTYYVNASAMGQCPTLPPGYVTVLMNEASNGGVRTFAEGEAVHFYDEGGPDGNYSTYNNNNGGWTYTFKAPAGKRVRMDLYNFQGSGNENLSIYDGTPSSHQSSWGYCCNYENLNATFYAESGTMTVRWQNYTSSLYPEQIGWDALVGVENGMGHMSVHEVTMASANVTVKAPISPNKITTEDLTACYGTEGYLTASAPSLTGSDLTFTWYGPDLIDPIHTETVSEGGTSQLPRQVLRNETYYVSVSNAENCAVTGNIHNNYREILLNNGETISLAAEDSVCIYDIGGKNGDYTADGRGYYNYFNGPTGSKIRLHISSLQMDGNNDGSVRVSWHDANGDEVSQLLYGTQGERQDFESADNWMEVFFSAGYSGNSYPGLDAYVYVITPLSDTLFASANVTVKAPISPSNITTEGLTGCYGTEGYLTASAPSLTGSDLTFTWYGPDLIDPIHTETVSEGGTSQLPRQVLRNETYYVSVSNAENCAVPEVIHYNYREVLMGVGNEDVSLAAEDSVCLYDRGGKDGDYTASCTEDFKYFNGPTGSKIYLHITSLQMDGNGNGYVEVSWHDANGNMDSRTLYGTQGEQQDFESADNFMRVRFNTGCDNNSYPGLDAYVYANKTPHSDTSFAAANVTVKAPISPSKITTEGLTACYGTEGYLQASAPSLTGSDLTFTWYGPDLIEPIHTETVSEGGTSQLPRQVLRNETYYVSVSNAENCAVRGNIHNNYREMLLNNWEEVNLAAEDSVCLYDMGGKDGDYTIGCNGYYKSFYGPSGSKIHLHISNLQLDDNYDAHVYVSWHGANGNEESLTLYGTQSDLDFESEDNWMYVSFNTGCNSSPYPGLDAYVYAMTPHSDTLFAPANVTVKAPISPSNITTEGLTACYGTEGYLTASAQGLAGDLTFKWYGPDLVEPIRTETVSGGTSQLPRQVLRNETYYVSVSNAENCAVMENIHNNHREVLLTGGSTSLAAEDSVCLYDIGGKDGYYTANSKEYTRTFRGPSGSKVHLHISTLQMDDNHQGYVQVSWHDANGNSRHQWLRGTQSEWDFESEDNWMEVRFSTGWDGYSYQGLDAYVYVKAQHSDTMFASANVTVKGPISPSNIMTEGLTACYNSEDYLQASAPDLTGSDLTFTWYGPDLVEPIHTETVSEGGTSQLPVHVLRNETYYVTVSNAENCAVTGNLHNNYREVLLNTNGDISLAAEDSVCLYDIGGKEDNYTADSRSYSYYFYGPTGSKIRLHISSLQLDDNHKGYVQVYWYDANGNFMSRELYGTQGEQDFVSEYSYLHVTFYHGDNGNPYPGLDAYVYVMTQQSDALFAPASVTVKEPSSPSNITTEGLTACYGTNGYLTASAPSLTGSDLTFKWYGPDLIEPIHTETVPEGGTSQLPVQVLRNETYYVSVSNAENCEVMEAIRVNHREVLLNNWETTNLAAEDSVCLYDMGGKDGDYTANCKEYSRDFRAPSGSKIHLHISNMQIADGGRVEVSWHNANGTTESQTLHGTQSDLDFESADNWMYVYFYHGCGDNTYPGLDAYVYAKVPHDATDFAPATVSVKTANPSGINTQNAVVCYGEDAVLTATTELGMNPVFRWYAPDLITMVKEEAGQSSTYTVPSPETQETYYVTMTNDTMCPFVTQIHDNYREFLFGGTNGGDRSVGSNDSVCLYDAGGKDGNCEANGNEPSGYTFIGPEGSRLRLHVNSMDGQPGNGRLEVRFYDDMNYEHSSNIVCEDGTITDTNLVSMNNKMYVKYYPGSNHNTYSGLDAYLYVLSPIDTSNYAKAQVTFQTPVFTSVNVTGSGEYCYGNSANLTASVDGNSDALHYVWYDKGYNVVKQDTAVSSTYNPQVMDSATYYVNASAIGQCPVLPPGYVTVLMNEASNGKVRTFEEGEAVHFYDEGGPDGNYSTYNDNNGGWTYTFKAPAGKWVKMNLYNFQGSCNEYLTIYDGTLSSYQSSWDYNCNYENLNATFYAESGTMTVRWRNYTSSQYPEQIGWDALVGVEDGMGQMNVHEVTMGSAKVKVKAFGSSESIVTENLIGCYGTEGYLKASAPSLTGDLTFKWYDSDLLEPIYRETVPEGGTSRLPVQVLGEETYYVSVFNAENCEVREMIHNNYREVLMGLGSDVNLAAEDSVCLYDMGGKNGNYTTNCSGYFKYFYGPSGSKIRLHISSLQMDDNNNGRVRVRWHNANGNDESRELYGTQSDLNFESADNWMEVYFHTGDCNGNTYPGLDAYVYAMTPHSAALFASAQVDVKPLSPSLVNIQNDAVCYGQDAELKASSTIAADQYFVWFEPDRITAHYDTVHTIGAQSTLTVPSPQEECTYYVTVSNDTTCPFVGNIYSNEDTILFDENNSGPEINVDETLFHIYDDGGPVGNYGRDVSSYKYFYTSVDGAKIKVHFDTIALANDDARVYIYKTDNSWEQVFDVRGPKYISDTDIVVDGRRIEISFYNDSPSTAGGFAGTVSTIVPHRMSDLIPVPITFAAPEVSSNVVVSDTLACYGVPIALRASITGNSSDMHYVWYNEDMRLMHEEVGVTSTYPRLATANERFFVNAVASGQCAIFPPNYNTVLLNESTSGDSYTLAEGEIIPFYDEGGPNGNYSTYVPSENAWTYTFKAPSEKQVTVKVNRLSTSNVDFRVYDGTIDDNNGEYYCYDGETYTSTTGMMTFRCYTYTPVYPDEGWDIQISVPDNNDEVHRTAGGMSYGTVSIIQQTSSPDRINTQDAEVCFGSPVTLTASASASEAAFPQIYTWYNPERTEVLLRDTLFAAGQSDFTVIPEQEETYWIALSGDGECPIVEAIHDRYENDIWFTYSDYWQEKVLTETNIYRIYDDGGPNGDYYHEGRYFYANRSFRANIANSKIKVHFDTIALASSDVELSVRDQQNDNTVFKIRGPKYMGDTSILVNATSISIYFNNDESTWAAGGFAGYVHAITPHNEDELKEVHVTFAQPTINSTISVNDGEACFGDEVELVATSTSIPSPQVFAWFDEDYNFLESDTVSDGQSTFSSPVLSNTTYYVNATEQGDCPVLPPHYGSIMLNASTSGQSYTLAEGEAVPFYDEGGPNGNYSTYVPYENAWTYTFMAPAEKQVTVKVNGMNRNYAELLVYDGIVEDNNGHYYCEEGNTYTSTTGKMTFRWHTDNPVYPSGGWDILVGVKDVNDQMTIRDFGLASANVTVKQPTLGLDLLVTNDTVCYGSEAYLTAKATAETQSLLGYPQYFTWYAPNGRTILLKDTVDGINKTQSELTAPYYYQRQDQNYYVTVGNHDNCPVVLAPISNVFDVHLNSSVHNQTTVLTPSDAAMFHHAEGYYYQDHNSDYTHTFQTLQGNLRVKFYAMDKGGIEEGDTLYIYDASTADENAIIGKVSHMEDEDDYGTLSFVSTGKYLTFRFESEGSDEGWEALIMPVNMQADMDTAQVFVQVTSVSDADITVMPDMICMGQTAEVSASANISYPQYYVWYDANMEVRKRDTLRDAAESPSMLPLPAHFVDASYYALVYSDTVSCMMNTSRMERIYSELPITEFMSGFETQVSPTDSIRVFTPNVIEAEEREAFHYYFTADTGLIQIHFNELMMEGSDIGMEFIDEGIDDEYAEYEDGTYYDLTVTSLNNRMHLAVYRRPGDIFSFDATVTNIGAVNDNILSKLAQADVTIKMNNSTEFVTTINDTVCYGSPALLTASAPSLGYPQYYTWYNNDMSQILYKDTIESGVSNYYVTDNMGRATYLVNVENDTTCPIYESTVHPNIREYSMLPSLHMQNLFVGLADSIVVYDEGGKDGDYSVDDRHGVAVILETYPGATFNIRVPTFVLDPDGEAVLAIFEYDEDFDGDEPDLYFYETQTSEVVYNSFNNRIVLYWEVDDEGDPAQGFEVSVTAQTHPEKNLAKAKVELNTLPYMNTLALTADPIETTICQGDDVALTATSTLPDQPQYFVWYNSDFTSVLAADTVQSGNEGHANIANLTQDTLVYVSVGTDEICPAYPMDHKFNVQELYLTAPVSGDTTILTLVDSVLFYDEGGPDENYHSEEVRWMQTFTAANPNAHVKIYFKYIELNNRDCSDDNWLAVVQGPIDFEDLMNNDFLHEPFVGEDGPLFTDIDTMTSTGNSLTVVWQSECYKGHASMGWEAYVYTDEPTNVGMDAFAVTKVNVNPSYRYTTYDSVCASATLYDVDRFQGIDISVPGDYTIDSVYHTSLGCDSIYSLQLHVHSNPVVGDDALVTPVACNGGSTGIIDMSSATVTGGEAPFTYTLFQNGTQMASFSDLPVGTYKVIAKDVHGCYSDSVTIDITEPDTLHLVSCPTATEPYHIPTGESYVTVEFEDPTFAPTLNNARITERQGKTANNQYGEGTHTITYIIQNDCGEEETCSVTFTVEDFDPLAVTLTVDSVTCYGKNNGAATVAITGGKPGSPRYTYTVTGVNTGYTNNNTTDYNIILSDLAPDRYTVHIEDMQGTPIDTAFNIGQPDTMVVTVTAPSVSCPNATSYEVSLTTTGGNGLNQYEWGADATNANATSTVVERVLASDCGHEYKAAAKVTDRKGCVATDTVSFVFEDLVKPNATMPADTTLCRNALTGAMEAPTSVTGEPTNLSDNCTSVGNLTIYSIDTDTTGTDREPRVIHREWHVKDGCNNDSIKVQNITIRPSVLTENNITFTCPDMTITLKYGACDTTLELDRTLINNMTDMTVTLDSTGVPYNRRYNAENSPYTITWKVTDECGGYVEYTQNVTVLLPPCGPGVTAIDGDGIAYPTIRVGCNCWTARNARSTRYTDGTPITPAPMQYPGTEQHPEDTIYCKLYTYNAATRIAPPSISPVRSMPAGLAPAGVAPTRSVPPAQVQGICPDGWHIPDDEDFADLMAHWEGEELNAVEHWLTPGTNISGFTMEPGGCYNAELNRYEYLLVRGYLWSYTPGSTVVHACEFGSACGTVEFSPATMETGYSVRCVHNAE